MRSDIPRVLNDIVTILDFYAELLLILFLPYPLRQWRQLLHEVHGSGRVHPVRSR